MRSVPDRQTAACLKYRSNIRVTTDKKSNKVTYHVA